MILIWCHSPSFFLYYKAKYNGHDDTTGVEIAKSCLNQAEQNNHTV